MMSLYLAELERNTNKEERLKMMMGSIAADVIPFEGQCDLNIEVNINTIHEDRIQQREKKLDLSLNKLSGEDDACK